MTDIKLFRLNDGAVSELDGTSVHLEKSLQTLIETNLEDFFGVRFLVSEFSTKGEHGGRMDTLGIDENGCPVIIEYKRSSNENVINQGLFYLDWLMENPKEFEWLVLEKFGKEQANNVEWSTPRLICIAGDFNRYDEHAVKQMDRNIELIRYRKYGEDLLLFDLVNVTTNSSTSRKVPTKSDAGREKTVSDYLADANQELTDLYQSVHAFLTALGDDVQVNTLQNYFAFKRIKNFACVEVRNRTQILLIYVKINPDTIELVEGFSRDVRKIGHFGTGDLELSISDEADFERAKPFLEKSYEAS